MRKWITTEKVGQFIGVTIAVGLLSAAVTLVWNYTITHIFDMPYINMVHGFSLVFFGALIKAVIKAD